MRFEVYVPVTTDDQKYRWFQRIAHIPACACSPWTCVGVELERLTDWECPRHSSPLIVCRPMPEYHVGALRNNGFTEVKKPALPDHVRL